MKEDDFFHRLVCWPLGEGWFAINGMIFGGLLIAAGVAVSLIIRALF